MDAAALGYEPPRVGDDGDRGEARAPKLTLKRVLAMLVLPASLLPVTLLGPGELNAPRKLARETWAAAVRFERKLEPARARPMPAPSLAAQASLGAIYGHWHAFPQVGREGIVRLGPTR
jgi:hypothetical protein